MQFLKLLFLLLVVVFVTGCARSGTEMWDDTVTCGRHVGRGFQSLCGSPYESRQVCSSRDFWLEDDASGYYAPGMGQLWEDYESQEVALSDLETPQEMNALPPIQGYMDPSTSKELAKIFKPMHFEYNSQSIKGADNINILQTVANYLKQHPNTYVYIEGHCDARGPEAYNLALGTRRSNEVRTFLLREGVSEGRLQTVSYGKERLVAFGQDEASHSLNRRAEFKLYQK